jgi:hypothetical protein
MTDDSIREQWLKQRREELRHELRFVEAELRRITERAQYREFWGAGPPLFECFTYDRRLRGRTYETQATRHD